MEGLTHIQSDLIDATIDGDVKNWEVAARQLGDDQVVLLVNAIFLCVVWEWFPMDPTGRDIADAAQQVVDGLPGVELQPLVLEAVMRLSFGENNALDSIDGQTAYQARIALTRFYFNSHAQNDALRAKFKKQIADGIRD